MSKKSRKKRKSKKAAASAAAAPPASEPAAGSRRGLWLGIALVAAAGVLAYAFRPAESNEASGPAASRAAIQDDAPERSDPEAVPPFYADPEEAKPFPTTLSPTFFREAVVARAYEIARKIPEVLVQQPCYCWCHTQGHGSLLHCHETRHAAG